MRKLILAAVAAAMSVGVPAEAGKREWYVGIEGGAEFVGTAHGSAITGDDEIGIAVLATIGRRLGTHFSLEGELGYRSTSDQLWVGEVDVNQVSMMVNAIYDLPLSDDISFGVGAGVGYDRVEVEGFGWSDDEIQIAAQIKLGLSFELSDSTDVSVNYRFMTTFGKDYPYTDDYDNSTLTVGLRFAL